MGYILLIKTTAAQSEAALSYHRVRGLFPLAVVFAVTIMVIIFHIMSYTVATSRHIDYRKYT